MSKASELLKMISNNGLSSNSRPEKGRRERYTEEEEDNVDDVTEEKRQYCHSKASRLIRTITHDILEDSEDDEELDEEYYEDEPDDISDNTDVEEPELEENESDEDDTADSDNTDDEAELTDTEDTDTSNTDTSDTDNSEVDVENEEGDRTDEIASDDNDVGNSVSDDNPTPFSNAKHSNREANLDSNNGSVVEPDSNSRNGTIPSVEMDNHLESFMVTDPIPWDKISFKDEDKDYIEPIKRSTNPSIQYKALLNKGYIMKDPSNEDRYIIKTSSDSVSD